MTGRFRAKPAHTSRPSLRPWRWFLADLIGVTVQAIYKRDQRARKRLAHDQRRGYVEALKRSGGRRVRVRPISLSSAPI